MKKYLFPFFAERHRFLLDKWWFRLVMLVYIIGLVLLPFYLFGSYLDSQTSWCYNALQLYSDNWDVWRHELEECQKLARATWPTAIGVGVFGAPLVHYFIQFTFFKVIIDFIALGTRFKKEG